MFATPWNRWSALERAHKDFTEVRSRIVLSAVTSVTTRRIRRADSTGYRPFLAHGATWAVEEASYDPRDEVLDDEARDAIEGIDRGTLDRLLDRLAVLAPREVDVLELRAAGCTVQDIGFMLNPEEPLSQQSCTYLAQVAVRRLKTLAWLEGLGIDEETIGEVARLVGSTEYVAETVQVMWRTQSYAGAALVLEGRSEGSIRHAFFSWIARVEAFTGRDDRVEACRAWIKGFRPGAIRAQGPRTSEDRAKRRGPLTRPSRRWK